LPICADAPLDHLTALTEDVDLAFLLVHVDANMVHGWPLPSAALTARCSCGALCHHVKREASRFIPSTLFAADGDRKVDRAGDAGTLVGADRCTLSQRESGPRKGKAPMP